MRKAREGKLAHRQGNVLGDLDGREGGQQPLSNDDEGVVNSHRFSARLCEQVSHARSEGSCHAWKGLLNLHYALRSRITALDFFSLAVPCVF